MRAAAFRDLLILAATFWSVWSLRYAGVEKVGFWTTLATCALGFILLRARGGRLHEVGLVTLKPRDLRLSLEAVGLIGLAYFTAPLWIALLGPLETPDSLAEGPKTLEAFFIDILLFTWIGAALGEEVALRGFVFERFRTLIGGGGAGAVLAALAQAIWFGAGHAGQGAVGMAVTGVIGFLLALYFLTRARGSLWPLVFAHAVVNTAVQTIYFVSGPSA